MSFEGSKKKVFSVGPYGSGKGSGVWDDGVHSMVRQVVIYSDHSGIRWIQFEYDDNGRSVWSEIHGYRLPAMVAGKKHVVQLDFPDEFLTSLCGSYWDLMFMPSYITNLLFKSNRRTYGPFGPDDPMTRHRSFSIEIRGSKIVGFHGRADLWVTALRSIGAYLTPIDGVEHHDENEGISYPAKPLLPSHHSTVHTMTQKDEKPKKEIFYIISGNRVSENEGDHNGTFVVGSKAKYTVINL